MPMPLPLPELDLGLEARRSSGAGGEGLTKEKANGTNKRWVLCSFEPSYSVLSGKYIYIYIYCA